MPTPRDVLTPATFAMLQTIAAAGSFASAARTLKMVPSALTYRVRQIEDALDVLLFDRRSRRAVLTEAGAELLREGAIFLSELDAVANRVMRVARGWEPRFTISVDAIVDNAALMAACRAFMALDPPTQLTLRTETLSGTLDAVATGRADLAIGVVVDPSAKGGLRREPLGVLQHVFTMSPRHRLAALPEPLTDDTLRPFRATVVADSVLQGDGLTIGALAGQDAITLSDLPMAIDAQLAGLAAGYLPLPAVKPYLASGRLVARRVVRPIPELAVSYVWRTDHAGACLAWWLTRLHAPAVRAALLGGAAA